MILTKQNIKIFRQKKSALKNIPGEIVRYNIIKTGIKAVEKTCYGTGNKTEVLL